MKSRFLSFICWKIPTEFFFFFCQFSRCVICNTDNMSLKIKLSNPIALNTRSSQKGKAKKAKKSVNGEEKIEFSFPFKDKKFSRKTVFLHLLPDFINAEIELLYGINIHLDNSDAENKTPSIPL